MNHLEPLLEVADGQVDIVDRLIEIAPAVILVLDLDGRVSYFNRYFEQMAGVTLEDVRGQDWFATFLPERDRERIRSLFERALAGERVIANVNPIQSQHGEERVIEWSGGVLSDDRDQAIGLLSVGLDVTKRSQLEARILLQSRLVDEVSDAIISTDPQGRIESWNRAAQQIYGYSASEAQGQQVGALLATQYPPGGQTREQALERVRKHGRWRGRVVQRTSKGSPVHVQAHVSTSRDATGQLRGMVSVNRDISAQVRAEERLRESERRYRAIFQQQHQLAGILSLDGTLLAVNDRALDLVGAPLGEVIGRPFWETAWWAHSPEQQQRLRDSIRRAASGETVRFEAEHPRASGGIAIVDFSIRPVVDEEGQVEMLLPEAVDITERRALEQQLAERERLATIGTVASVFAHEVGNPLNNMAIVGRVLAKRLEAADADTDTMESMSLLLGEIRRLGALLHDFRDFGRRQRLELEETDLRALVDEVLRLHVESQQGPAIAVKRLFPEELPSIAGSRSKLKQVLINLCKNAVEAMPDGGALSVVASLTEDAVVIEISDTGTGIPDGVDVFQPFESTKEHGTGLGLPIARQIVMAHGGDLDCSSVRGEGTTFTLTLPRRSRG